MHIYLWAASLLKKHTNIYTHAILFELLNDHHLFIFVLLYILFIKLRFSSRVLVKDAYYIYFSKWMHEFEKELLEENK